MYIRVIWTSLVFFVMCLAISSFASTLHVPSSYPTIQDGINAALAGDTIMVADGTYSGVGNHSISFLGKDVTVLSENGAESTAINLEYSWRAFSFDSGETRAAKVHGFTIQYGRQPVGAAIYVRDASPVISSCRFSGNAAGLIPELNGAGGALYTESSRCSLLVENCSFSNNAAYAGGAAFADVGSHIEFYECTFEGNEAFNGPGGALMVSQGSVDLTRCVLADNSADSGGAVTISSDSDLYGFFTVFSRNRAVDGGAGALDVLDSSSASLTSCTLVLNDSRGSVSQVRAVRNSVVYFERCLLAFGRGPSTEFGSGSEGILQCTDIFGNTGGDWTPSILDQLASNFNFSENPLICDTSLQDPWIQAVSPCNSFGSPCGMLVGAREASCPCCLTYRGDVNNDGAPISDISDLTYIIRFFFKGGTSPSCSGQADIDRDYGLTTADIDALINYMFRGGQPPPPCL